MFLDGKKTTRSQFSVLGLREIHRNLKQKKIILASPFRLNWEGVVFLPSKSLYRKCEPRAVIIYYLVPLPSYLKAQKTKFFQNYPKKQSNCMVFIKNIFTIILECITMILCIIWLATQKLMLQNTKLTMKSLTTGDFQTLKSVHNK